MTLMTLGLVVVTAVAWSPTPVADSGPNPEYVAPVLSLPLDLRADCGYCAQSVCAGGSHWFHFEDGSGPDRAYGEGSHGCDVGWCGDAHPWHPTCDEEEEDAEDFDVLLEQVWKIPGDAVASDVVGVLAHLGERVSYNPDRQALQVTACNGEVLLSVPDSPG